MSEFFNVAVNNCINWCFAHLCEYRPLLHYAVATRANFRVQGVVRASRTINRSHQTTPTTRRVRLLIAPSVLPTYTKTMWPWLLIHVFKFSRILKVVKTQCHVLAKFSQAKCSGLWVTMFAEHDAKQYCLLLLLAGLLLLLYLLFCCLYVIQWCKARRRTVVCSSVLRRLVATSTLDVWYLPATTARPRVNTTASTCQQTGNVDASSQPSECSERRRLCV